MAHDGKLLTKNTQGKATWLEDGGHAVSCPHCGRVLGLPDPLASIPEHFTPESYDGQAMLCLGPKVLEA